MVKTNFDDVLFDHHRYYTPLSNAEAMLLKPPGVE
jgi:hypothetical protein